MCYVSGGLSLPLRFDQTNLYFLRTLIFFHLLIENLTNMTYDQILKFHFALKDLCYSLTMTLKYVARILKYVKKN